MKSLSACGATRPCSCISLFHFRIFFLSIFLTGVSISLHALDYYWVGGSGMWSDHNNHWATTSGGSAFHDQVPTSMDNVYFDANSFPAGGTVTIDPTIIYCMDMDWTGATGTPVFEGPGDKQVWIYGSLTLISDLQWNVIGEVHFRAFQMGKAITTSGINFVSTVFFDGVGGEWTFLDEFTVGSWTAMYLYSGTIRTNNQTVNAGQFWIGCGNGNPQMAIYLGSSIVNITNPNNGYLYFCNSGANLIFDAGTSTINFQGTEYGNLYFPYNLTFYDVIFNGKSSYLYGSGNYFHSALFLKDGVIQYGSNTFENLTFSPGHTYILSAGSTQTITPLGNFIAEGTGGFPIEIKSSNLGQQAILHKDGDPICLDFLYLTDMAATGTGFRYAGANSDDVSNNSGWIFSACADCFSQPAAPAPALDPSSVTQVLAGEQANLVIQNVPMGNEVVWFNEDQTQELYADVANQFQPVINAGTVFYAALRDVNTGCVSEVLSVSVSVLAEYTITASAGYCTDEPGPLIGLDNSYLGYSYQLQTNGGANLGASVAGTGFPITFGSYPNGDYQVVVTGPGPTQTITGTVNATSTTCRIDVPNFCICNAADGRADVTVKLTAPSGQNWTVKMVVGLYLTSSPPAPAAPIPMPIGTPLTDIGGNMYTLDGIRLTTKGFWVQVTNGSSVFDIMVGNASW